MTDQSPYPHQEIGHISFPIDPAIEQPQKFPIQEITTEPVEEPLAMDSAGTLGFHSAAESQMIHFNREMMAKGFTKNCDKIDPEGFRFVRIPRSDARIGNVQDIMRRSSVSFQDDKTRYIQVDTAVSSTSDDSTSSILSPTTPDLTTKWGKFAFAYKVERYLPEILRSMIPPEHMNEYLRYTAQWREEDGVDTEDLPDHPPFLAMNGSQFYSESPIDMEIASAFDARIPSNEAQGRLLDEDS
jgi:hypothetical protein